MPGDSGERPKAGDSGPNIRGWSQRDYGNRVGFSRLRDLLIKLGFPATVALNSSICDYHSEIVDDCLTNGWEIMGHGITNLSRLNDIPLDKEKSEIVEVTRRIQQASGKKPKGWLGVALDQTWNTLEHLASCDYTYVADWVNDDQPYVMKAGDSSLVSVPYTYELNDISAIIKSKYTPNEFERMIKDQFDVLYEEGGRSGRVMAIALHPYIMGQPHRIPALERALSYISGFDGVWKTTGAEIADHFSSQINLGRRR
jgi:peptidoglycan/xylan/chitin deacetylase (PgdA/CDA1 family)